MRGRRIAGLAALVVLLLAAPARAAQDPLQRYAEGTWASFVGMTDEQTGLPADFVKYDGTRSTPTSPTNIGAYLWSAVSAERLGIIGHRETVARLGRTLTTLERMERGQGGQYFNWYDIRTGEISPTNAGRRRGDPVAVVGRQRLARGRAAGRREPRAGAACASAGALRLDGLRLLLPARPQPDPLQLDAADRRRGPCCYDTIVSESRIASYVGIEKGELPAKHYYGSFRAFPDKCDIVETKPLGETRSYLGQSVFEGALPYAGTRVTPSWGGSMFEALMPSLFVPEERWGPGSWGINHPLTARAQIFHGLTEAGYGYWGFSPANKPEGGYDVYGVDGIGMDANGNASNEDKTLIDRGYEGCTIKARPAVPDPPQSDYTNGVVTPHASFLALRYAPREALANLRRLERDFPGIYGRWGFRDTVNVDRGETWPGLGLLPLARPGHGHGRPRQRARRRRAAARLRDARHRARAAAATRRRGVRRHAARVHDHRHLTALTACAGPAATTSSAASAATTASTAAEATTRSSATRAPTGSTAATEPTRSTATTAPTRCPAATATTSSPAGRTPTT